MSHEASLKKTIPGGGVSKGKGPEVGVCGVYPGSSQVVRVAGAA